jgi:hypothetical protein
VTRRGAELRALARERGLWKAYGALWAVATVLWCLAYVLIRVEWGGPGAVSGGVFTGALDGGSWAAACLAAFVAAWVIPVDARGPLAGMLASLAAVVAIVLLRQLAVIQLFNLIEPNSWGYVESLVVLGPSHFAGVAIYLAAGHGVRILVTERERRLAVARLEVEVAQERFRALKTQLRPRFLFDHLESVSRLAGSDPPAAERLLAQLGELLRTTFRHADRDRVPLSSELGFSVLFLEVERTRGAAPVRFRATAGAATRDLPVPHLSVFALVESALLCAAGAGEPLAVEVSALADEGWLRVEVSDGGALALAERRAHAGWEPVELLLSRLRELNGGHRLEMEDAPGGGVAARLWVPLAAREAA